MPPRQATYFLMPESRQRTRPDCLRPFAALRASLRHAIQSAVRPNSLRASLYVQTNGRKSDHEALALCGANARSLNSVPQAQPDGRIRAACGNCEQIRL
jgi:hypothetical protein